MGTKTLVLGATAFATGLIAYVTGDTQVAHQIYESLGLYGSHAVQVADVVTTSGLGLTIAGGYTTAYEGLTQLLRGPAEAVFGDGTKVPKAATICALGTLTAITADTQTAHQVYHQFATHSKPLETIVEMAGTTTGLVAGIGLAYESAKDLAKKLFHSSKIPIGIGVAAVSALALLLGDTEGARDIYQNLPLVNMVHPSDVGETVERASTLTLVGSCAFTFVASVYYGLKKLFKKD